MEEQGYFSSIFLEWQPSNHAALSWNQYLAITLDDAC
jgi:hypothetical protein